MISDLPRWNLRLSETLTPHQRHLSREVKHEVRIPNAEELARLMLARSDLPAPGQKCRLYVPVAFLKKGTLLSGLAVDSSHAPINILNFTDGDAFTLRILDRLIGADGEASSPYFVAAAETLARELETRYLQFAEIEACLGDVVTMEYTNRFRHDEATRDNLAAWRLAMGWRQNRFRFESDLLHFAASYHFHFEVPDGYILKDISVRPKGHDHEPRYTFNGQGTPDGHIYVPYDQRGAHASVSNRYLIFIDCFEAPPGSQGYTAVIGLVTSVILFVLMMALSHGWFIDSDTGKVQATGAIALIAGGPAVVASLLPLRNEPTTAIRTPLTARIALWTSSAMSAYVALLLATQGFGIDLATMKDRAIVSCFLHGLLGTAIVVAGLLVLRSTRRRWGYLSERQRVRRFVVAVLPMWIVLFFVAEQEGHVSLTDYFFSLVIPVYLVILARCVSGWFKSVYIASGIRRRFEKSEVV
ncbi:hypothetical protein [Mycolicibacterium grossiae]|uniref:hypothetical protein n=1 Tax=Mycolicibacterium grossiae TaxID=1552759 RepID=UPI000F791361|nr:hypothetical protein [Mycolicibacterium grossiae]QEM43570.1 hypothetical protein FZ046_01175 [Mycolicibacterium grossiae]